MLHRTLSPSLCFQSMIVPVSPECSIRRQRLFSSWDTASEPLSPTNRHIRLHPKGFHGLERVDVFVEGIACKWLFQEGTGIILLLLSEWLYYTELLQRLLFVLLDYIVLFQLNISFLAVWLLAWGSDPLLPECNVGDVPPFTFTAMWLKEHRWKWMKIFTPACVSGVDNRIRATRHTACGKSHQFAWWDLLISTEFSILMGQTAALTEVQGQKSHVYSNALRSVVLGNRVIRYDVQSDISECHIITGNKWMRRLTFVISVFSRKFGQ